MTPTRTQRLGLEPGSVPEEDWDGPIEEIEALHSIARSLKRIADTMEKAACIQLSPTWEQVP